MESFILICRMVRDQGYNAKILNYLLVNKALEVKIKEPDTMTEHLLVEFN